MFQTFNFSPQISYRTWYFNFCLVFLFGLLTKLRGRSEFVKFDCLFCRLYRLCGAERRRSNLKLEFNYWIAFSVTGTWSPRSLFVWFQTNLKFKLFLKFKKSQTLCAFRLEPSINPRWAFWVRLGWIGVFVKALAFINLLGSTCCAQSNQNYLDRV